MSETLDRLREALGDVDAERLLKVYGGTRVWIPDVPVRSQLATILGEDAVARIRDEFGPGYLAIPMAAAKGAGQRRALAKKLLTEGVPAQKVALAAEVHIRTVERYAAELRDDDGQTSFPFD